MRGVNSTGIPNPTGISNPSGMNFDRSKTHANIGTIGHIGHGETSLTQAIALVLGGCSTCKGTGKVKVMQEEIVTPNGSVIKAEERKVICSFCDGSGRVLRERE